MATIALGAEVVPGGPFALVDDTNLRGGYRIVLDHATRDAIIVDDRKEKMLVRTLNDGLIWELGADLMTWTLFSSGGGAPLATTPPVNVDRSAAVIGVGTSAARNDHKHDIAVAAPVDVGIANAAGVSAALASADHVHNTPFSAVQNALSLAASTIIINNQKIGNLLSGTLSTDAVNKGQLDTALLGLHPKANAIVISLTNVASLSGPQTVNGVALTAGNRVLLNGQTTGTQNGLWVVQAGAWTRPTDFLTGSSAAGAFCFIEQGTLNANTGWVCSNTPPTDVVDVDSLTFVQFSTFQLATAAPLNVDRSAAVVGSSSRAAKEDHKHDVTTAAPVAIGTANSAGVGPAIALSDHVHDHGAQTDPTQHALATALANGFLSAADYARVITIPNLATILGAVIVEDPSGTRIARRLTEDDIDPAFAITGFAGGPGSAELGTLIVNPSFTASYNASLASATLNDGLGPLPINLPATAFAYNAGPSGLPARTFQKTTVNGTQSWTLSATKIGGSPTKLSVLSANLGLTRRYYDIVTVPGAYDEFFIKALAQNNLTSTRVGSYVLGVGAVNKKIYLCWPNAFGVPASIKDQNGFVFPMTRVATGTAFTNTVGGGFSVPGGYDVWESDNFITAAFTLTVT